MKAKYIGTASKGFESGKTYQIRTNCRLVNMEDSRAVPCLCFYDKDGSAWCAYENLEEALKEWEVKKG